VGAEGLGIVAAGDFWGDSFASWPAFAGKSAAAELGRAVAAYGMILLSICGGGLFSPSFLLFFRHLPLSVIFLYFWSCGFLAGGLDTRSPRRRNGRTGTGRGAGSAVPGTIWEWLTGRGVARKAHLPRFCFLCFLTLLYDEGICGRSGRFSTESLYIGLVGGTR